MAKDYENEEYLKGFKRDDLDAIRESYLEASVGDEINTMPYDELNKINGKIFKEVKKIYSKYYKDIRRENGLTKNDEINMDLWDKAVGKYEDHRKAVKRFWAGLGLGALIATSAITAKTALPAGNSNKAKIETQDTRTKEEKGENVVDKDGNVKVNQKSEEAKAFEAEMKKEATKKTPTKRVKKETPEEKQARIEKEDSLEFYDTLIDSYNEKYQGTQQQISKDDTSVITLEGTRLYTYYGVRKSDDEIMYVDDMSKNVEQAAKVNLQYNEEGKKPENYTYVLDTKNDKIIVTTASLDGKQIDVLSNYYQGSSNKTYTNPAGDDIDKALTVESVLKQNPDLFKQENLTGGLEMPMETKMERATNALKTVKEEMQKGKLEKETSTDEIER